MHEVVLKYLQQKKSIKLCGQACLLIRCLLFENQVAQTHMLRASELMSEVIKLTDLAQLINEADIDQSEQETQECAFYALLALIELARRSVQGQQLARENGAVATLLSQLRSGSYATKKTACLCLQQIVEGNGPN